MNIEAFAKDIILTFIEGDHMDVDGCDFQDLMTKHGLIEHRPITEEECKEEWAQEYGYEPGDSAPMYTKELKSFLWPERERGES